MDSNSKFSYCADVVKGPPSIETKINDEKDEAENETIKVTDLNDYCLESIFNYLNVNHLLNVAQSNTRFQYAAAVVLNKNIKQFYFRCGIIV